MARPIVLVLVALAACDRGKSAPAGVGSATESGSGSGAVAEPASAQADAMPSADAAVVSTPTLSAAGGLSTLGRFAWNQQDEEATAALIQQRIGLANVAVRFDVLDVPGEVEREEGYWSVKRGDTELVQVLRTVGPPDGEGPAAIVVWTAEVPTLDGIKVGDSVASLLAKKPDLGCELDDTALIAATVAADLQCRSAAERSITYVLDARTKRLKRGKVKPASIGEVAIVAIAHEF